MKKLYRLYYVENGVKHYVCYVPTAQLGIHFCADPDRCAIYADRSEAEKSANWYTEYCGNVREECLVEEYGESRSVSQNRWNAKNFLLTELVPGYEKREWTMYEQITA